MIPLHLSISGFLSYRQPVEIDFTGFELACIAGANGAGKSSLLDAITWSLFGQARKRDDSLINTQSEAAEVSLTFAYEGNVYRVQRTKPRDKTTLLEFHILQCKDGGASAMETFLTAQHLNWKPLTERILRETEARIQQTLRLDYETFVNAAFFLQGNADQFTQQRPGDRKRILGNILGLEIWETYRQKAAELRKNVETEVASLDGRLQEISAELDQEQERKARLQELEEDLERLSRERAVQESALENIRKIAATLAEQRKMVETLYRQLQSAERRLEDLKARAAERQSEKESFDEILAQASEIEAAYAGWQEQRAELERWEEVAGRFREQEKRREGPRDEINAARARLVQEQSSLQQEESQVEGARSQMEALERSRKEARQALEQAEQRLARKEALDSDLQTARKRQAEAKAENPRLKAEMDELKERIDRLSAVEGADCPLCGQPLSPEDRHNLVQALNVRGKEMGDRYRANLALMHETDEKVAELEEQISDLSQAQAEARQQEGRIAQLNAQLEALEAQIARWEKQGAPRLEEIARALEQGSYAPEAHARLAEIDAQLKEIGYDAAAHDAARQAELQGRASADRLRALERARAALAPLARELEELERGITSQQAEVEKQSQEYQAASTALQEAEAQAPDLVSAERDLLDVQERENRLRLEVGAARQEVLVLEDLKERRKKFKRRRKELSQQISQYKQVERAFGKDGVPALLIEQALPQIETKANEILERLSGGSMSVRFITQAAYKDKHREDLKETLDIQISDEAGIRDYEMFSGGEAFRVNFAIRLALSEILAQRAGARLQTLVIDEGFGSQDALGRQRLIEAINMVRPDFSKILVITHIDELKDAFPNRIEVEKTESGSMVRVI
ncbi:MAG: SMC family ATPase [Anaerolineales bacterium]